MKAWSFDFVLIAFLIILILNNTGLIELNVFNRIWWTYIAIFLISFRELLLLKLNVKRSYMNPGQLFIASFILVILIGSLLLLLPGATHTGISVVNALFTATSAVCVTGLVVVDTGTYFTLFGQSIIMILIQIGGLGIMTFTSYFGYFFRGGTSYENQLLMKDMANTDKIAEIYRTFKKIILLTLAIECAGAIAIFICIDTASLYGHTDPFFFSIFHSISGFCNAGFSTFSDSLYEGSIRYNYPLQGVIALLFITGGLGFLIVFNFIKYIKHLLINRLLPPILFKRPVHKPWVINLNARIVVITTLILLIMGTSFIYLFEAKNTLSDHQGVGKILTAFFTAATPRTAGFNVVETSALHLPSILLIIFLMWVGASPGSTGGGIKTSSLAVAILNGLSLAKGRQRIELYHREISHVSVRRAFAIMFLSLSTIGISIFLVAFFEEGKDLLRIVFECFSAFGTVGLSMGITAKLSTAGKLVIILTMFIGRIGALTLIIALLRKVRFVAYRHPTEDILIN
ncbi:MAG: ATPase [Bacteroidales bacterium]|nr:ATPase [Bacteroidales bacterium]